MNWMHGALDESQRLADVEILCPRGALCPPWQRRRRKFTPSLAWPRIEPHTSESAQSVSANTVPCQVRAPAAKKRSSGLSPDRRRRSLPHGLVLRAKIILLSASGMTNQAIAARLELRPVTVGHWRRRFLGQGLRGLHDELRPGRPRSISDERVALLIRKTLRSRPPQGTAWSCRSLASQVRVSKDTVHRVWHAFGLQPHRQRHFQLSNDPFFVEKVGDVVGLYLTRRTRPWCCARMKKARSKPWNAPSHFCPWAWAMCKA